MIKKIKLNNLAVSIVMFIVCVSFVSVMLMQFKTVEETDITDIENMREAELRKSLAEWKSKYEETSSSLEKTNQKIAEYQEKMEKNEATSELIDKELEQSNLVVGRTDVTGEGVIVTLNDGKEENISAWDLIYLVNELRYAGAEAISINDERIVSTTDMADVGGSIKINSKYLRTDTYIVKAIGNSSYLESSLFGKGGFVEQLDISGIKSDIERSKKVSISKYTGDFETKYMQEKESKNNE